mmetsp:Transcript_23588/g.55867  ORF Transcript_23588/g.55867 Transcript_23588/m.55867 type:complete len:621 (+) Transcript_23588:220-2082(+)
MRIVGKNGSIVTSQPSSSRRTTSSSKKKTHHRRSSSSSSNHKPFASPASLTATTTTDNNIHNDAEDPYHYLMMGGESLMVYCSTRFCCGGTLDDSYGYNRGLDDGTTASDSFRLLDTDFVDGGRRDYDETRDGGSQPMSSMDPEYVFREELNAAKQLKRSMRQSSSYDEWSCDSSLSSHTTLKSIASNSIVSRGDNSSIHDATPTATATTTKKKSNKKKVVVVMDSLTKAPAPSHSSPIGFFTSGGGGGGGSRRSTPALDRVDERPYKEEHDGSSSSSSSRASADSSAATATSKLFPGIFGGSGDNTKIRKKKRTQLSFSSQSIAGDGRNLTPAAFLHYHDDEQKQEQQDYRNHRRTTSGGNSMWMSLSVLDDDRFNHRVLGTSTNDDTTRPHVLTNEIMDNMQRFLPYSKQGEFFWLKYSMVRDGANLKTVLHKTKLSSYTVVAVETLDGEVFGAFTSRPWHVAWKYFGTPESFLWRLSGPKKKSSSSSSSSKTKSRSSVEVFRFAGNNNSVQLCNDGRIAVGGGIPDEDSVVSDDLSYVKMTEWGFGLSFGKNLQQGTSSPCMTFNSPSLSRLHSDGSCFEVANIEFWTLTPCTNVDDARRMEEGKHFIEREGTMSCR